MRGKKITLISLMALSIVALFTVPAMAELAWYVCSIDETGMAGTDAVALRLSDTATPPAFTSEWFQAQEQREKEMLAIALSAMMNNMNIRIYADKDAKFKDRVILNMYISK
jgi:hypothetical protein